MNLIPKIKKRINFQAEWFRWYSYEAAKLKQFNNIHKNKDCFIIGNGPSLNNIDLSYLNNYYTFGLNKIFLIFKKVNLQLSYLVSVNPFVIEQSINDFTKLNLITFLAYRSKNDSFQNLDNFYYLFTKGGRTKKFQSKITKPVYESGTVTFIAMQLAYYMGFKNIFLIGVDHNFKQQGKPNTVQKMNSEDINHFDPNYFKGHKWHLADLESSERGYQAAKKMFEQNGRKIFDATENGKLQIFEKINFSDALSLAKKK